jgi:alcohol dehydrogenase
MKAIVVTEYAGAPQLRDVPEPVCPPDGVVIEVRATGLCRSDWHGWAGHDPGIALPHVPGHEFAGVVTQTGPDVSRVRPGDRVTVPFVCACGRCSTCRAGAEQVCENQYQPGFTGWGSFAERVAVPRADLNVVALPAEMSFDTAAALGCRFATAYRAVSVHGRVGARDKVAVFGCGGVGLSAVMIAAARGADVIAVDVSASALAIAAELGAGATVCSDQPVAEVRELSGGGVHVSIDAFGAAATCRAGIESLRPRGRHVQIGLLVGADAVPPMPMAVVIAKELEIYGSHGMAARDYNELLTEVGAGRLRPELMITERVGLDRLAGSDGALARMGEAPPTGTLIVQPAA